MIKKWRHWLWLAGVAASLGVGVMASAQTPERTPFQPFKALFGPRTPPPEQKAKAPDANRMMEIAVEMAWLSDPTTFPYYLEAHVKGSGLEVRGFIPTKAVRAQAVSLAKLHCPLPVTDSMKEHASLAVRPSPRGSEQLQRAVETSLREAFPGQRLTVECHSDGNVQVSGSVRTLEEKLAVSQSMRRLHGCTSVDNLARVGSEVAPQTAAKSPTPPRPAPAGKTPGKTAPAETQTNIQPVSTGPAKAPAQIKPGAPYESRGVLMVSPEDSKNAKITQAPAPVDPAAKTGGTLTAIQLKKRIESALPGGRSVQVTFTSKTDVRVECAARPGEDSGALAGQILSLRDLDPYKVDLQIQVSLPERK